MEGAIHEFDVDQEQGWLFMCNNDDPSYWVRFDSWEEVEQFIEEMRKNAEKAFGAQK